MSKRTIKRKTRSAAKARRTSTSQKKKRVEISRDELQRILDKASSVLSEDEVSTLEDAVDTLAVVTSELEQKGASVRRLRNLLFGSTTEKMNNLYPDDASLSDDSDSAKDVSPKAADKQEDAESDSIADNPEDASADKSGAKQRRKGHGRNPAKDYTGAQTESFKHESLNPKDNCPECLKGRLYVQKEPARLVRVTGTAPLAATVYELERLRCNLCGQVFTAKGPEGLGAEKYDYKASAMIALLKYGSGMPFHRLERLEKALGIPLPTSTQWEIAYRLAMRIAVIYTELIRQAAQGDVLHNDDTTAKILNLESLPLIGKNGKERTGLYTSGILSTKEGREIALFFTGRKHAGENLAHVLSHRNEELSAPIQMCDGLSANTADEMVTILANCNSHARRQFVELKDDYVNEVKHILGVFKEVYKNDDTTKNMSDGDRLDYHIKHSKPLLDDLINWFEEQTETEKNIEPNSTLGTAITYMAERWEELTLFLQVPGAPLDNNACERVIKKAILHRKNALFFKTENGAYVSDLFMSLIHTCELGNINPFEYLVALAENNDRIEDAPENWMPWNYQAAL
jgi:hypothetical protein